jgi:hypothetical protein
MSPFLAATMRVARSAIVRAIIHCAASQFADATRLNHKKFRPLRGEASPLTEAKRGVSEVYLGQTQTGLNRIERAVSFEPDSGELYDILVPAALLAGRLPLAVQAMQSRLALGNLTRFHEQLVDLLQAKFNEQMSECASVAR